MEVVSSDEASRQQFALERSIQVHQTSHAIHQGAIQQNHDAVRAKSDANHSNAAHHTAHVTVTA